MLKRSLLFGIGMTTCLVPCWPDTALAQNCQMILDQQIVPPQTEDLVSLAKAILKFAIADYNLGKASRIGKDGKDRKDSELLLGPALKDLAEAAGEILDFIRARP